jgi:hypothetical protein
MTTTTTLSNAETVLAALDKEMAKLGAESVNIARPKLAITLVKAAAEGSIDEDDVEARYDAYLAGRTKAQSKTALAAGVEDGNGKKANVSKCRQLVRMAMMPGIDGPALIDLTVTVRGNLLGNEESVKPPFDAFVDVARAQINCPAGPLTEEQIADVIRKAEKADKTEIQKLIDMYKRSAKMRDDMPAIEALARATDAYAEAIVEAGGEVPPLSKEEKEQAAAMAYLARRGLVVVPALPAPIAAE